MKNKKRKIIFQEIESNVLEGSFKLLEHKISFWFKSQDGENITNVTKKELIKEAKERARIGLEEGYFSGELFEYISGQTYSGWWNTERSKK
jgi:hypothetical protein